MSPTNKKEIEPMKKLICLLLSVLLLVGASVAMADSVKLKIATWTSNETQLALLGSFVDEFAQKRASTSTTRLNPSPARNTAACC